jgi:uncharacterized membrane protein
MKRVDAIDFTRGLVMIIMALDHTRDLFHLHALTQAPTDLATTTPWLFFTRWITHVCAPVFVFLSGTSAYLSFQKKGDLVETRRFLLRRGLWLLVLEFTIVNFGVWFDLKFRTSLFQVIAAIGFGFIFLAFLIKLPAKTIGLLGLLILLGHNLLPRISFPAGSPLQGLVSALFSPNVFQLSPHHTLVIGYPPVPWLGIMLVGFACGPLFGISPEKRKALFLKTGLTCLALFILLRSSNFYGDPFPWGIQKNNLFTFLSFINVTKYPPSLLYCCLTLGLMWLILSFAEGLKNTFSRVIILYGQVPLFYYLMHWYLLHTLLVILLLFQGFQWSDLDFGPFHFGRPQQPSGVGLGAVYLIWLSVVAGLYPLCRWYGSYRTRHPEKKWLRYL